jgi:D-methionine transport system permease protein
MVGLSALFAIIAGLAVGILLYVTNPGGIREMPKLNRVLGVIVNVGRSIPFVILIIAVFPLSKLIVGTAIGSTASIVPLTISAIPFVARLVEASLNELGFGIIEVAISAGATPLQIVFKVLLPESASGLVSAFTITVINIIGYSAMAGTIGGGGLGDIALRIGYQRFRTDIMIYIIIILVILVQVIQLLGQFIARKMDKR